MKFPAIPSGASQNPTIRALIECVEILTGRRRNREIDYGTIDGVRTKVLDIVHLCNMGRIKARAYRNAPQNIDAAGWTKVAIDTISRDTEGVVDIVNGRITPNLPGDYIVFGNVRINDIPYGVSSGVGIFKNGSIVSYGPSTKPGADAHTSWSVPDLIYMNGTTDYLELYVHNGHSSALALTAGQSYMNYLSVLGPF